MDFTSYLNQLPSWLELKKICKGQAVLDLIICGQEFETYHRYAKSNQEEYEGNEARIGFNFEDEDGPSLHLYFTDKGCLIVPSECEDYQSAKSDFYKRIPKEFQAFFKKNYSDKQIPFVFYALEKQNWQMETNFETEEEVFTLGHLTAEADFYKDWATIFFGEESEFLNDDADAYTITEIYNGKVLTEQMVLSLVSKVEDWLFLENELSNMPYRFDF
jgi:hypothetical protein